MNLSEIILTECAGRPIHTFRQIELVAEHPLVLLDIDDTVITWKREFMKMLNAREVEQTSPTEIKTMYNYFVMMNDPEATDLTGFNDLVKRAREKGGEVCFLTSRKPEHRSLTLQRLKSVGIDTPDNYNIYFAGSKTDKGTYIVKNIDLAQYGEVVFVDDLDDQLSSVKCKCPQVRLYQFQL